jgi:hypothetical protein
MEGWLRVTEQQDRTMADFRIGPFTAGDLIALGGVIFMSGAVWWRVGMLEREALRTAERVAAIEQFTATNYVRRDDYRDDMREIRDLLQQIAQDLKAKQDKHPWQDKP